jgi:hypothetical protein
VGDPGMKITSAHIQDPAILAYSMGYSAGLRDCLDQARRVAGQAEQGKKYVERKGSTVKREIIIGIMNLGETT